MKTNFRKLFAALLAALMLLAVLPVGAASIPKTVCGEENSSALLKTDNSTRTTEGYDGLGPKKIDGGKRDFIWPVPSAHNIKSCFYDQRNHRAIDIASARNPIVAMYSGTVKEAVYGGSPTYYGNGYGNYVVLQHTYTTSFGTTITLYSRYAHMYSLSVSEGQTVSAGTQLGLVGTSGNSTGNHLHFEILYGGWSSKDYSIDPYSNFLLELPQDIVVTDSLSCGAEYLRLVRELYSAPQSGYLDLNGRLDGVSENDIRGYGTVDLYINGEKVADDIEDYYSEWPGGTTYEFKDIKPHPGYAYRGVFDGNRAGTVGSGQSLYLTFSQNDFSIISETPESISWNGHNYLYYSTPVSWYFAKEFCETQGGHLVTITSEAENNFVRSIMNGANSIWTGGSDQDSEGSWYWVTGEPFAFFNWQDYQPDNYNNSFTGEENFLELFSSAVGNGYWNDEIGCKDLPFVLEIDSHTVTFVDWDGTILKTETVEHGHAATAPSDPTREGYTFTGWDVDFSNVTSDLTVTAQYEENSTPPPTTPPVTPPPETPVDPDAPQIVAESKTVLTGDSFTVNISLANNPGLISMALNVQYADIFTLTAVNDTEILPGQTHSDNLSMNPYLLSWVNDSASSNYTVNGTVVTLTFSMPEGTEPGDYPITISYDPIDVYDYDGNDVDFAVVNGTIHVIDTIFGDVNSDGTVNARDRLTLVRYLAKWTNYPASVVNMNAADVNMDGAVNARDRLILIRHLAKWIGYETLPKLSKSGEAVNTKDAGNPVITVSSAEAVPGETVEIIVSIADNPGLISMALNVHYDSALTLIAVNDTELLPGQTHSDNYALNPYLLSWVNDAATSNYYVNGDLVKLTFVVSANAEAGEHPVSITYNQVDVYNYDGEDVTPTVADGAVTVPVPSSFTAPEFRASMACIRSRAAQDELTDVRFIFKAVFNKGYIDNNGYEYGCADADRVQITEWGVKYSIGTLVSNVNYVCPFLADANDAEFRFNVVIAGIPEAYNGTEITMTPYMLFGGTEISGEPFTSSVEMIRND